MSVKTSASSQAGPSKRPHVEDKNFKGRHVKQIKSKRARSSSVSSSEDETGGDKAAMLAALEAHSRALFGLAEPENGESSTAGRARFESGDSSNDDGEEGAHHSDDGWGADDGFVSDSEEEGMDLAAELANEGRSVPEVVFAPSAAASRTETSKAERRAFLKSSSSKMMGLASEDPLPGGRKRILTDSESLEDQNHRKLDKSLHDMLLANLLPTAAVDAASRPVEKRNAMYGRLRELADLSAPGQGSDDIRGAERRRHPAKIRTILIKAKEGRDVEAKKEDMEAGNYVRGLGGLTDGGKRGGKGRGEKRLSLGSELRKKGMDGRKKGDGGRDRGLGMGIGRFEGGMLKLSERDIARGSGGGGGQRPSKRKGGKGKRR